MGNADVAGRNYGFTLNRQCAHSLRIGIASRKAARDSAIHAASRSFWKICIAEVALYKYGSKTFK
jgi:hypothetical protein